MSGQERFAGFGGHGLAEQVSLDAVAPERRQEGPIRLLMGIMRGPVIETFSVDALLPLSFDSAHLPGKRKKNEGESLPGMR